MDRGAWWATVHGGRRESDTTERLTQQCLQLTDSRGVSGSVPASCPRSPQSAWLSVSHRVASAKPTSWPCGHVWEWVSLFIVSDTSLTCKQSRLGNPCGAAVRRNLYGGRPRPLPPTRTHLSRSHLPTLKDSSGSGRRCTSHACPAGGARPAHRPEAACPLAVSCGPLAVCSFWGVVSARSSQRGAEAFSAVFKAQLGGRSRQKGPFPGAQPGVCLGKVLECCHLNHVGWDRSHLWDLPWGSGG